jgi:hypothetical protein
LLALLLLLPFGIWKDYTRDMYDVVQHVATAEGYQHIWLAFPEQGYEAHQGPLYYVMAGKLLNATQLVLKQFGIPPIPYIHKTLHQLNFVIYGFYLLYGLVAISRIFASRQLAGLLGALLMFWPGNVVHCCHITNDTLLYLTFFAASYHYWQWLRSGVQVQFRYALLWLTAALMTKNTALVLCPVFAASALYYRRAQLKEALYNWRASLKANGLLWLAVVAGFCIGYGRVLVFALTTPGSSLLEGRLRQTGTWQFDFSQLLALDVSKLITCPYIMLGSGHCADHQYFNFFLRSLSYGEYQWYENYHAMLLNITLFALLACVFCWGVYRFCRAAARHSLLNPAEASPPAYFGLLIALCLVAGMTARSYFNFIPWADARHIYMVIPFFLLIYGEMMQQQRWYQGFVVQYSLGIAVLVLSVLHILLQHPLLLRYY